MIYDYQLDRIVWYCCCPRCPYCWAMVSLDLRIGSVWLPSLDSSFSCIPEKGSRTRISVSPCSLKKWYRNCSILQGHRKCKFYAHPLTYLKWIFCIIIKCGYIRWVFCARPAAWSHGMNIALEVLVNNIYYMVNNGKQCWYTMVNNFFNLVNNVLLLVSALQQLVNH